MTSKHLFIENITIFPAFSSWGALTNILASFPASNPVIPRYPSGRRRVGFVDDGLPSLVEARPKPFARPPMMSPCPEVWQPQHWTSQILNPELRSPLDCYPRLDWDLTQPASSAQLYDSPPPHTAPDFSGPAIWPPTPLLTISYANTPDLFQWENTWGPIFVCARARGWGLHAIVTLEDVLDAIYVYFNTSLSVCDQAAMSDRAWRHLCDAYHHQFRRARNGIGRGTM
ncbi:hypothetical protein K438DRAFT_1989257 [Mycena galopus ATCC 62051]|nr:hypothetical protein K438DRAFT_1989257 [Mycena galopus ATCC 62051]